MKIKCLRNVHQRITSTIDAKLSRCNNPKIIKATKAAAIACAIFAAVAAAGVVATALVGLSITPAGLAALALTAIIGAVAFAVIRDRQLKIEAAKALAKANHKPAQVEQATQVEQVQHQSTQVENKAIQVDALQNTSALDKPKAKQPPVIQHIPGTDSELPRTDPKAIGAVYSIVDSFVKIADKHDLKYWGSSGTVLGAIRHKDEETGEGGMIGWDDDADFQVLPGQEEILDSPAFRDDLDQVGLMLVEHWGGYKLCPKVCPSYGKTYTAGPHSKAHSKDFHWPFIDVFISRKDSKTGRTHIDVSPENPLNHDKSGGTNHCKWRWNYDYWEDENLQFPLPRVGFGPVKIPIPHNVTPYLTRDYGPNWATTAKRSFDHTTGKHLEKPQIVKIVNFAPAFYDQEVYEKGFAS